MSLTIIHSHHGQYSFLGGGGGGLDYFNVLFVNFNGNCQYMVPQKTEREVESGGIWIQMNPGVISYSFSKIAHGV